MGEIIAIGMSAVFGASALATPFDILRKAFAAPMYDKEIATNIATKLCAK